MLISGIYALTNNVIVTAGNVLTTNYVDIDLKEYFMDLSQKERLYNNENITVYPGSKISIIPKIINLGSNCYVRAKLEFKIDNEIIENSNNSIFDILDGWEKHGDYFYYNSILNSNETITIFNNIKIPNNISNEYIGKKIIVSVSADAIQSDNFKPDFTLEDPWYNIKIEKSVDSTYVINNNDDNFTTDLKFENNAEKYIEISKDFFNDLNKMVPGDIVEEQIKIINKTDKETEYFYGIETPENISDSEKELLKKCILTVVKDGKSTLYSDRLLNHINNSIGKLKPSEEANVKFIIQIPKELDNSFSNLNAKFSWKFSVQPEEKMPAKQENEKQETEKNVIEKIVNEITNLPKTGDLKFDISLTIFLISAVVLIIVLFLEYRLNKGYKKTNKGDKKYE